MKEQSPYREAQNASVQTQNNDVRWKAFGQKRTLFIPVAAYAAQQYALNFFLSNRWQRYAISLANCMGVGRKVSKGFGEEWSAIKDAVALTETIAESVVGNSEHLVFAMRQGSVGPYQKMSLIAIQQNGTPSFYGKVAVGDAADAMVEAESTCLQRLSTISTLNGMVPLKLNSGQTPAGRSFFTTSVAPFLKTSTSFEAQYTQFLSALGHATVQWVKYEDSSEFQFTKLALERLSIVLGTAAHAELRSASEEIISGIGEVRLPTVLAHRDFSPWNIRCNASGIFVFDWEYAADGANPLYDFFHFHLIQRALSEWKTYTLKPTYALSLISPALVYLQRTFPEVNWTSNIVRQLLLVYLVDLMLFYVDSDKLFDATHPVLSAYFNLILTRKQWLEIEDKNLPQFKIT
ncbi:MAG: phosphotransferase [Methylotenera sp.]|nr:phosphotransferase [Methylotenera sp.]